MIIGLIIGLVVGACVGCVATALLVISSDDSDRGN